mmetsp:Transcript_11643/g.16681  ORF Transcript_11643/g.16681 Transcript_11643/m.16681 type:complete len:228 (+) Transcript_11643:118-801(+)
MVNPYSMKWRCLPHGCYTCMPTLLATVGWLATLTEDGCNYAIVEGAIVTEVTTNPSMPFLEVGMNQYREASLNDNDTWEIDYNQLCKYYNEDVVNIDGVWKFSKIMSFLALVFAGAAVLLIWFSSCFIFSPNTWKWVGCELLTATVFKLLSYSWLATSMCRDNSCSISYGAKADIVACVTWFISGVLVLLRYPMPKAANNNASTANESTNTDATPSEPSAIEMPDIT